MELFDEIKSLLDKHKIVYEIKHHPPTPTSEEAAKARSEPLKIGAKAIVIKADEQFYLLVLPANRKIDSSLVKKAVNSKDLRFAMPEELFSLTGLRKGAVPPFGLLLNLPMLVDQALLAEEFIAFNAGSLEHSIKMKTEDYLKIAQPKLSSFSTALG